MQRFADRLPNIFTTISVALLGGFLVEASSVIAGESFDLDDALWWSAVVAVAYIGLRLAGVGRRRTG